MLKIRQDMLKGKLNLGDVISGFGGIILFLLCFFPWFSWFLGGGEITEMEISQRSENTLSIWEGFPFFSYFIFLTALSPIIFNFFKLVNPKSASKGKLYLLIGLATVSSIVIFFNIIDPPMEVIIGTLEAKAINVNMELPIFIGLLSGVLIIAGNILSLRTAKKNIVY